MSDDDSDYNVEEFVKPDKIRKPVNDDSADLLGNFDDVKRKEILDGTYEEKNQSDEEGASEADEDDSMDEENSDDSEDKEDTDMHNGEGNQPEVDGLGAPPKTGYVNPFGKKSISKDQLAQLMKGASKTNRYVLYVTNLNFETTKSDLEEHFSEAGTVRSVRIPKKRSSGFAFVEMNDIESFGKALELHNTELQGQWIKVQFSEAGKKKSANKKNIMKQKNRKLAEMRNENKLFTKSGKFYDKTRKPLANKRRQKKISAGPPKAK
ncbi:uncharacterized protein LOC101892648 [Musca domestica]|uniref:Uncharacterized RNA-binding protein C365.04c n=1 Tax=Musca domestica TaxID=7370 RepID=A0A1I8MHR0_MUSDO|nr:uncharacterized protein LOC101892648 [Musca domestica]